MANERTSRLGILDLEAVAEADLRAVEVHEVDKDLPWIVTIDSGADAIPSNYAREGDNLRFNHIVIRNPNLIQFDLELHTLALIVLNPDSTTLALRELIKFAPVVVVIDRDSPAVNHVEEMYREGAEAVLDKASDPRILNAAVNEVLRRSLTLQRNTSASRDIADSSQEDSQEKPVMTIGGLEVNVGKAEIKYEGNVVDLTEKERQILFVLLEKIDTIVTRQTIVEAVWEHPLDEHLNSSLRVHVNRLRGKLPGFIKTKINGGYMFMTPRDETPDDASSEDSTPGERETKESRSFHMLSS